jgi:hypothetical protein
MTIDKCCLHSSQTSCNETNIRSPATSSAIYRASLEMSTSQPNTVLGNIGGARSWQTNS